MSRERVVLYNPESVFFTMPLGLLAVGSALDPERYDVVVVDGRLEPDPVAAVLRATEGALCLGMGVLTGAPIRDALRVSRAVKARRPELPVVWGGWHPSLFPEQCLAELAVDVVVQGQGEATFRELVHRFSRGESVAGTEGCAHRADGEIALEPQRRFAEVNGFAPSNYALIPIERYFELKGKRQLDYVSSQGCRFRCAFCADPFVYRRGWSGLDPGRVVDELRRLWYLHAFDEVSFQDETFFTSASRVDAFAEALLGAALPVTWTATLRADQGHRLDEGIWEKARRSGLARVMVGMESGSQSMLDWMKKDVTLEQVFASAERCRRYEIGAIFNVIVGFPGESDASVEATLEQARRLRAMSSDFEIAIFYYAPYPGSEMAREAASGFAFPDSLEAWADFDYVGGRGPWVEDAKLDRVERFRFYQKHGYGPWPRPHRWPLRLAARWRTERGWFGLPLEKRLVEWLRPPRRLS